MWHLLRQSYESVYMLVQNVSRPNYVFRVRFLISFSHSQDFLADTLHCAL